MRTAVGGPLISGRYRISGELGRGGMGAVFRARDETTGRLVALKTLGSSDARSIRLFEREYHTLSSLRHPRVIEVYDFGISAQGQRFYTMELLAGDDLTKLAPLPYRTACAYARDVATCLALLHARRLLHRDVSPSNVRLDAAGRAKLLDFGALGDFGLQRELVGTPPFMPAEALHQLPLDQRSDLFSFGATIYFALTQHFPYAVQRIEDIDFAQRSAPLPPSKLSPDIPPALDQLVLSLLSADPAKRPNSAAEVIDRLAAIAELDAEPLTGLTEGHLISSALIGRAREKYQLQQHLTRAVRGEGGVVIIDGAPGMGRTRLASELSTDARIAGMTTLRIDALAHPEPTGTLRALARGLLEVAPQEAAATLTKYAGILGQAFEELAQHAATAAPGPRLSKQPSERKALVQRALVDWLLEVCASRPLLLVVDDAHAVDADSAGVLVLIAHAAPRVRLLLAVTQVRDEPGPAPIQQLARVSARVRLRSLEREDIELLIRSVFGDVPHRARLAEWLLAAGRGNPGHSLDLLEQLVDRDLIRYAGGAWTLPSNLPEQELPQGLNEVLLTRVRALREEPRRLANMFALHRGALPLRVCLELAPNRSAAVVVAALDELVRQDMLVRADGAYRFGRDATRELLLRDVAPPERRDLHAAIARALMVTQPELFEALQRQADTLNAQDLGLLLQAASHLEHGGDVALGRELMYAAAVELTTRGVGLNEAVPALEAAVADLRAQNRPGYQLAPLLVPLTLAGTYTDFRLSYRYGHETLELLLDITGLGWADKLRPMLGGRLALALGLSAGFVRHRTTGGSRSMASYREVILALMGIGTALLGTFSVLLDKAQAKQIADRLEMLRFFPEGHPVHCVHLLQQALLDVTNGDIALACDKAMRTYEVLCDEHRVRGVRPEARQQLQVGCLTPVSIAYGLRVDGKLHAVLEALDGLHTSVSRQVAAGARAAYHGHRGERAKFIAYHDEMDMLASQAGSTWREDVGTPRQMWSTYVLCEDVIGLKHAAHDLDPIAEDVPSIRRLRDLTRASYLSERGLHERALSEYRAEFEDAIRDHGLQGARYSGVYARILRMAGESARAKQVCEATLARLQPADREFRVATFGAELELLLSTAALGALDEAVAGAAALIEAQQSHDNALLHGLAHKARAQIAVMQRDAEVFVVHLNAMEGWFRRTDNPALIAQCQRLTEQAKLAGVLQSDRNEQRTSPEHAAINVVLEACRGPAERLRAVIDVTLAKTGAEKGYLYLCEPSGLRYAAPAVGTEPPETLREALETQLELLRHDPEQDAAQTIQLTASEVDRALHWAVPANTEVTSLFLLLPTGTELIVVGALVLVPGSQPLVRPEQAFLEAIARALFASGDVRTVYFDPASAPVTVRARRLR